MTTASAQKVSAAAAAARRTALDEIVQAGRAGKRQERWVVLGGLLQQGKRNLSYEEKQLAYHERLFLAHLINT